jgi:hypothetical protein
MKTNLLLQNHDLKFTPISMKGEIMTKMGWVHLKIFFSITTQPEKLIFT